MARASLFKYLSYDKLTDKHCNEENSSGNCAACPVREECAYIVDHDAPLFMEIKWFLESIPCTIRLMIANFFATHKKTHYTCSICGLIEAPYFGDNKYLRSSITHGYGWWKAKSSYRRARWVCHHCMEHSDCMERNELQDFVVRSNKRMMDTIKNKDPNYYRKWFGEEKEV